MGYEDEQNFYRSLLTLEGVVNSALKSMKDYEKEWEKSKDCYLKMSRDWNEKEIEIYKRITEKIRKIECIANEY